MRTKVRKIKSENIYHIVCVFLHYSLLYAIMIEKINPKNLLHGL